MMSKVLLTVLVISLAYVSDAVFFRDRFPGKKFGDMADCKEEMEIEGATTRIPSKNSYGTKHAVACGKYCLKQKLRGERKGDDKLKAIVGSEWVVTKTCTCFSGEAAKFKEYAGPTTSCIFKTEEKPKESNEEELIPGETCWEEGKQFMGTGFDTTASGKKCDVWTNDMGKNWHYYDDNGEYDSDSYNSFLEDVGGAESGNLCRNYALDPKGPYCFVGAVWQSPSTVQDLILRGNPLSSQDHFEYCDIPKCPTEEPELVCDVGFQQENSCYFRINAKTNYANAKTACEEQGAQLAHFSSPDTVKAVVEYLEGLGYGDYHWTAGDGSYIGTSKSKTITWLNGEQYTTEFWYSTSYPKEEAVRTHFALVADPYNRGKEGFINVAPTWVTPYPLCVTDAAESTDVNECAANDGLGPCQNEATCTNTEGSFTCNCKEGFTGDLCEEDDNNDGLIPGKTCWKEGEQFMGTTVTTTASGKTCDTWSHDFNAWHMYDDNGDYAKSMYLASYYDIKDETAGNYCRNYKEDPNGPYCFVGAEYIYYEDVYQEINTHGNILTSKDHFEYCDIPKCP